VNEDVPTLNKVVKKFKMLVLLKVTVSLPLEISAQQSQLARLCYGSFILFGTQEKIPVSGGRA